MERTNNNAVQQTPPRSTDRITDQLNQWDKRERGFVHSFGQGVLADKDFMRAKRMVYKDIYDQYKNNPQNFNERITMRVLKGQLSQMEKRLFPNPLLRGGMHLLQGAGKLLAGTLRAIGSLLIPRAAPSPVTPPENYSLTQPRTVPQQQQVNNLGNREGMQNNNGQQNGQHHSQQASQRTTTQVLTQNKAPRKVATGKLNGTGIKR